MTEEQQRVIEELRSNGYAVAIIEPKHMGENDDPENIEDLMRDRGLNAVTA